MKRLGRHVFFLFLLPAMGGCSFNMDWLHLFRARRAAIQRNYASALGFYQSIMTGRPDGARALTAAREGARIAHLEIKDYPLAVEFYKRIILRSPESNERKSAQRFVAQIYFENLQDFEKAVIEYERLLKLTTSPGEAFRYRLNLAKSHLQLNNIEQSTNEIDVILSQKLEPDEIFEAKSLKANILVASHRHAEGAVIWGEILKEFPERSQKDNVALNLVVCYEEMKDFAKAIEILENMKDQYPNPDFLNLRITRLKERKENQPGAHGWKR